MFLGSLIATLGVNTAGLIAAERSMKQFEARMNASVTRINTRLQTTGAAMKKFGRGMSMYMTAPLALVGGAAFKMHMSFESSMSKIVGLVGVAQERVDQWSKDIIQMAPKLGKAPKELADAMFFITSAGLRGSEALEVLEMSAKASASGLGETKIVADLVTSAMNAYGSAALNAKQATDILTATVREGKAQADVLASSMGMILPIASNMGVAFNQVGAAVAGMTRTGTSAQTASMQLRQILASLLKPSQQAEKALWEMGTSSEALRKTIREDGLLAALTKIKDLSEKYGDTVMAKVFPNIRALSGVLDIMGSNLEDNKKIFAELENAVGSAERAFKVTSETAEHKFNVAMASAKTVLTVLGGTVSKEVIPILERFAEKMQNMITWFEGLNDTQRRTIVRIAGLIAVIGPLSMALGWLVGNVLPGLFTIGTKVIKMLRIMTFVMLKNPIMMLVTGIGIAIAALISLKKKTKEAADAQSFFNSALEEGRALLEESQSIEDRMKLLGTLNKRQLTEFQQRIENQIKLEENFTTDLLTEFKRRLKTDDKLARLRKNLMESEDAAHSWHLQKLIKFRKEFIMEDLELENQANQKRMKLLNSYLIQVEKALAGIKEEEVKVFISEETVAAMLEFRTELKYVDKMVEYLGNKFEGTSGQIEICNRTLQTLARLGLAKTSEEVQEVLKEMKKLEEQMKTPVASSLEGLIGLLTKMTERTRITKGIVKDYTGELAKMAWMNAAIGDTYDNASIQLQIYTNALNQFYDVGIKSGEAVDFLIAKIKELNAAEEIGTRLFMAKAQVMQDVMGLGITLADRQVAKLDEQYERDITAASNNAQQKIKIEEEYNKKRSALLRKAAIAEKLAGIFSIAINTAKGVMDAMSKVVTIPLVPWIIAAGAIQAAAVLAQPIPKMAGGGIIPPGYPNDTYPAMLTSGEEIIPAGKLNRQPVVVNLIGEWELKGENMHYIVKEVERKHKNNF